MTHLSTVPSILHFNKFPFTKRRLLPSLNCTGEFVEDFPCDYTFYIIPVQESHCRSFLKHRIFFPQRMRYAKFGLVILEIFMICNIFSELYILQ